MKRATDWAHSCLKDVVRPGDTVVDATAGNGYDSTFLAKQIGPSGCLHIFDIQSSALEATQQRLHRDHPGVTASYYHCGHEEMLNHLSEEEHGIRAITFNLGYLPGALDKEVITRKETTLSALKQGLQLLQPGGIITIIAYPGHPGGAEEGKALLAFASKLVTPFQAVRYETLNTATPAPFAVAIEKRMIKEHSS